jgi:dual specificity tyrosine-phosphorylation-regulated kinase 2/3/4
MESKKYTQLEYIKDELTEFEKTEIFDYKSIYYVGDINVKFNKHIFFKDYLDDNNIFRQDDRYVIRLNDHISYRYKILDNLGKGSYGNVIKVEDCKYNKIKAIKLFNNFSAHTNEQNNKIFFREYRILELLYERFNKKKHEELFTLYYNETEFRNFNYIIFRLYHGNLYQERHKIRDSPISDKLIIIKDLLKALIFLTSESPKIIHADIKPENILFKSPDSFNIVLGDFGLSLILKDEYKNFKNLIQTRWYRSPEIIYQIPFNEKIDVWSFGCIIYELIAYRPLFKSKYCSDQLVYIHYILGAPTREFINQHENIQEFYTEKYKPKHIKNYNDTVLIPGTGCNVLDRFFEFSESDDYGHHNEGPCEGPTEGNTKYNLIRLVYKCLDYDHKTRISAEKALEFINNFSSC